MMCGDRKGCTTKDNDGSGPYVTMQALANCNETPSRCTVLYVDTTRRAKVPVGAASPDLPGQPALNHPGRPLPARANRTLSGRERASVP